MSYARWDDDNSEERRFSDSSLKLEPRRNIEDVPNVGKVRSFSSVERSEVLFMVAAFISIIVAGIITIIRINDSDKDTGDFTFAVLLLVNLIFIVCYVVHGVLRERPFEILVAVAATVFVVLYCVIEFSLYGKGSTIKLVRLVCVLVIGPIDVVLGIYVAKGYFESKNLIFRTVGANLELQVMCQIMFIFSAFLKFDFQIVISMLVLVLNGGIELDLFQKLILGIGVPFSFAWVVLGFVMVRYEKKILAVFFWLFSICEPIYIGYLFYKAGKELHTLSSADAYYELKTILDACIIAAGVAGVGVRVVLLILSSFVVSNFGKGLREKVYGDS